MGGQCHAPAALPPGKTRYQLYRGPGGPQGRSGWVREILSPPGFDPRTVQSVAGRYTDQIFFSSSKCPDRLWGPFRLIFHGYRFPSRGVNLTTHVRLQQVKNEWSYTYNPPSSLHGMDSDFTFVPFRTSRTADKTWLYILGDASSKTVFYKLAKNATREQDFLLLLTLESRFRRWHKRSNAGFCDKVTCVAFFESWNMNISWITQCSELW